MPSTGATTRRRQPTAAKTYKVADSSPLIKSWQPDRELRLGTDFSGLETASIACERVKIRTKLLFACEKEPKLRELIRRNFHAGVIYRDVLTRDISLMPTVDLFISCAPCPPWSQQGKHNGINDSRGTLLYASIDYIVTKKPKVVIMENVRNLSTEFIAELEKIIKKLKNAGYTVEWRVLDCKLNGIAQSRPRCYLVAVLDKWQQFFFWPEPIELPNSDEQVLKCLKRANASNLTVAPHTGGVCQKNITKAIADMTAQGIDPVSRNIFIDVEAGSTFGNWSTICPCITASRGRAGGFYITKQKRRQDTDEMMMFQGIPPGRLDWKSAGLSRGTIGHAIGNACAVNVLERLIPRVLFSAGLIRTLPVDVWAAQGFHAF